MKKIHNEIFTVYYENTDSSGFTYHTSYLSWAERARSNMLRKNFPKVISLLKNNSFFFVVRKLEVEFFQPSFLFDDLLVETFFKENTKTSIKIVQKFRKNDQTICKIDVFLVWIDGNTSKPSRIPNDIISRFKLMEVV